jgi:alkylation response protein AidB-like acyl-CoA dehydrogenase
MTATEDRTQPAARDVTYREARTVGEAARQRSWRKPSFGKDLFLGQFRLDLIYPAPASDPTAEAEGGEFLQRLEQFCRDNACGDVIERESRIPDELVKGLAALGVFGMKTPREYGGLGVNQVTYNRALTFIGSIHPSVGALVSAHQSIGVPEPLKLFGTPEQKKAYLPRTAAGAISAFLLTEPDVGSDPARLHTSATPTEDGTAYLLNGTKLWTTNGTVAELLVVFARVPESEGHAGGITAFVVEANSPGITVERRNAFMGLHGIENGLTRLRNVRVPAENVIGREGIGLKIAYTALTTGRLSLPALCTGAAKWAVKIAREWSGERVQWGRPIGEHAAIAHKIAFMAATAYAMEATLELSARLADGGKHDIRIEGGLAKLWSSEMAWQVADELVQVRGGRGYETADSLRARGERAVPAEQVLRDLRINRIFEGSTEIMHLMIAREAVDAHLVAAGNVIDPEVALADKARAAVRAGGFYAKWLPQLVVAPNREQRETYASFGPLAPHVRYVERTSRRLARHTFYGMARWQGALERRQGFLGRIVDIGAELFAMTAACIKARELQDADDPAATGALELAEAFCEQSQLRVERLFDALWHNTDDADERLARRVLAGQYTWLERGVVDPSEGTGPWIAADPIDEDDGHVPETVARRFLPSPSITFTTLARGSLGTRAW